MIRRLITAAATPFVAAIAIRPVTDRLATRLMAAPRRLPEAERAAFQAASGIALDSAVHTSLSALARDHGVPFPAAAMLSQRSTGVSRRIMV